MIDTIHKTAETTIKADTPHRPNASVVARLLASAMALSAAISGCSGNNDAAEPALSEATCEDGCIKLSRDVTASTDDGITRRDSSGKNTHKDIANTGTVDANDTTDSTMDTSVAADEISSMEADTSGTMPEIAVDTATVDVAEVIVTPQDIVAEVEPLADTTKPKTPQEICGAKKAKIIAALKPGEPECAQVIPGVGKVSGKLACTDDNLDPNCVTE